MIDSAALSGRMKAPGMFKMPTVALGVCGCALSSRPAAAKGPASMGVPTHPHSHQRGNLAG
jgi:hypothetical protein